MIFPKVPGLEYPSLDADRKSLTYDLAVFMLTLVLPLEGGKIPPMILCYYVNFYRHFSAEL